MCDAVSDRKSDLRLASFAMNTIDWETGMVFDVWTTDTRIYPYYERLNLAEFASIGVAEASNPSG